MGWAKSVVLIFVGIVVLLVAGLWVASMRAGAGRNEIVLEINKPALQVFPWLVEPDKMKQWITGMTEMTQLTPGPVGVGTKSRDVVKMGSETTVMNVEITAFDQDRLLAAHIDSDAFTDDIRYVLSEQNGKTRLEYTGDARYKSRVFALLEPLITPAAQQKLVEDTAKLRALIQAQ